MPIAVLSLAFLILTFQVSAAAPTDEASEIAIARALTDLGEVGDADPRGFEHLIPLGEKHSYSIEHGEECVAAFEANNPWPPHEHWCLISVGDAYVIRSWRSRPEDPPPPPTEDGAERLQPQQATESGPLLWDIKETPIPADLGRTIRQLWLLAVLNSRYQPAGIAVLDGADFVFSVERYQRYEWLTAHTIFQKYDHPSHWMAETGSEIFEAVSVPDFPAGVLQRNVSDTYLKVKTFYEPVSIVNDHFRYTPYLACGALLLVLGAILWRRRHAA